MLFGMGTVFMFLTLMVFATTVMSRLLIKYFPEHSLQESASSGDAAGLASANKDARLIAVMSAAIQQHRNRNAK